MVNDILKSNYILKKKITQSFEGQMVAGTKLHTVKNLWLTAHWPAQSLKPMNHHDNTPPAQNSRG